MEMAMVRHEDEESAGRVQTREAGGVQEGRSHGELQDEHKQLQPAQEADRQNVPDGHGGATPVQHESP